MKRIILFLTLSCLIPTAWAQQRSAEQMLADMSISNVNIEHEGDMLYLTMRLELDETHIKGCEARVYTPILYHGTRAIEFTSVGVFGREHYFVDSRQKMRVEQIPDEWRLRRRDLPAIITYYAEVPYQQWMNGSTLRVEATLYGCGDKMEALGEVIVAEYREWVFNPVYIDAKPMISSSNNVECAYIDFPLMVAKISPTFGDNAALISNMSKFFSSCECNTECDMTTINITGYASPDGEYSENGELAQQRAEALRDYIVENYGVNEKIITISSVAEDWDSVIKWLEASSLKEKAAILNIIKGAMTPDEKDHTLSTRYPAEYEQMLKECYPPLRRATYTAKYNSQCESLDAAAKSINAANEAMRRGDMASAKRYLQSAGTSPLADYARALYAIHMGNIKEGMTLLNKVKSSVPQAAQLLKELEW